MNITKFLDFAVSNLNDSQIQSSEGNALIAQSLRPIIEEVFMALAPSFTIVVSSRKKQVYNLFMNVMQYLFHMLPDMNIQLVYVDHMNPQHIEGNRYYNLMFIDSYEAFMDIDVIYYTENYNLNEFYHIFLMQYDSEVDNDMTRIFEYLWQNQILDCNIEIQNAQGELHMFTYFPFGPDTCDSIQPRHVNQFILGEWQRKPFFLPKVRNLYGCPLIGAVRDIPFFSQEVEINGTPTFKGYEIDMLKEMEDVMNFTLVLKKPFADDRLLPKTGGGINMLERRVAHFAFGYYRKRTSVSARISTSVPHYQSTIITAINYSAHKLKSLQVLTFAFRSHTWIAMAVCFAMTYVIAKFVHMRNPKAISAFSIVATTLGIPIPEDPQRLDSIFIFTPWLWCTFIMRTMYSGILYHLFSNDIYQSMPLTLTGAANAQYVSVMNQFTLNDVAGIAYYNDSNREEYTIILPTYNEWAPLEYLLHHDEDKLYGVVAQEFYVNYVKVNKKSGRFYVIPQILMPQQVCFYLTKHSFLINQFDLIILDLKAVGLVKFLMKRHISMKLSANAIKNEDKMIHQDDLYGIYMTCGCMHLVALGVFILELLSKKYLWLKKIF